MRSLIDAHLDIAWNAVSFDRDQLLPLDELRRRESGMTGKSRGNCTVSLPEMQRAGIRICLATLLCRALPAGFCGSAADSGAVDERGHGAVILREDLDYANQTIACAAAQAQLAYYRLLEGQGRMRTIRSSADLDAHWQDAGAPLGIILSMEGCDPIVDPAQAEWWYAQGLRTACLAHYGPSAYAMGTGGDGPLTAAGRELLKEFDRLGLILDLVHTADTAFAQALDVYSGPVFVSHGNCRALVPHDRQISDDQIRAVAARRGVIGAVLDEWMLMPDYRRDAEDRLRAALETVADHIDHVCALTGSCAHAAIGSDLDGGFGTEQTPDGLETIADLQRIAEILADRGYADAEIDAVFHGNWLRFFRQAL